MQSTSGDVVMLGLPGFVVLGVAEVDGELEISVETATVRVGCPHCGVIARLHGRREVLVRDVDAFGRRVRLRWHKRVWRCHESACSKQAWTEQHPAIGVRMSLSERARKTACRRVARKDSPSPPCPRLGRGLAHAVMRAVRDHGAELVDDPDRLAGVSALGMDETSFLRARRDRPTLFVSGLVDTATGRLLDIVTDRTAKAITTWLAGRDRGWLTGSA
jgi:transposase